jgi:hypothetical protein
MYLQSLSMRLSLPAPFRPSTMIRGFSLSAITFFCSFTSSVVAQVRASMLTEINANLGSTKVFVVTLRSAHSLLPDHANSRVGSPLAPGALATKRRPMLAGSRNRSGGRRSRELS